MDQGRLAPFLANLLPPHEVYCEPFAGSAAVFFAKKPVQIETINDINGDLVAFMKTLRDQPRALIRAIELTPYDRLPRPCQLQRRAAARRRIRVDQPIVHSVPAALTL
ncbi:DNA adenine methylase [Nonomuraea sp. K274]|uniref:site-specific DNA-methyltransferase (adenine-specific) n=1 Tax=Nonomuraea cypriaca TaxID=1187855 RepID=A0A931AHJ4_9ACTN|nr:DNA adenine methylase [Nonomuraea cypriaca]